MISVRPAGAATDRSCCRAGAMLQEEGGGITGWSDSQDAAEGIALTCLHGTGYEIDRSSSLLTRSWVPLTVHERSSRSAEKA